MPRPRARSMDGSMAPLHGDCSILENAGHGVNEQFADIVNARLGEFIDGVVKKEVSCMQVSDHTAEHTAGWNAGSDGGGGGDGGDGRDGGDGSDGIPSHVRLNNPSHAHGCYRRHQIIQHVLQRQRLSPGLHPWLVCITAYILVYIAVQSSLALLPSLAAELGVAWADMVPVLALVPQVLAPALVAICSAAMAAGGFSIQ